MTTQPPSRATVQRRLIKSPLNLGLIGSLLSIGSLLGEQHVVFDLLSHFRLQYIALIVPLLILALMGKRWFSSLILTICLCVHLLPVYQSHQRESPGSNSHNSDRQAVTLNVMTNNLLASNHNHMRQIDTVQAAAPDVIVFQEYTPAWHTVLSNALSAYPHKLTVPLNNPFGIAIYSRYAFTDSLVAPLFPGGRPTIRATVSIADKAIEIVGVHPPPPLSSSLFRERNKHLHMLASHASHSSGPLVIAGDLNTSPWSGAFNQFLQQGNLYDTRAGKGIYATWPDFLSPLQIPIDYIIVSTHFNVLSMHASGNLGSDHKTLWATLQL